MSPEQVLLLKVLYVATVVALALALMAAVERGVDAQAHALPDYAQAWAR